MSWSRWPGRRGARPCARAAGPAPSAPERSRELRPKWPPGRGSATTRRGHQLDLAVDDHVHVADRAVPAPRSPRRADRRCAGSRSRVVAAASGRCPARPPARSASRPGAANADPTTGSSRRASSARRARRSGRAAGRPSARRPRCAGRSRRPVPVPESGTARANHRRVAKDVPADQRAVLERVDADGWTGPAVRMRDGRAVAPGPDVARSPRPGGTGPCARGLARPAGSRACRRAAAASCRRR